MDDDYNYRMSDLEYKKYQLRKNIQNINDKNKNKPSEQLARKEVDFRDNMSELDESDYDIHGGDIEDNWSDSILASSYDGEDSLSLICKKDGQDEDEEFNLNVSFTGGYMPNTDLSRVDKGQGNPQFKGLKL